MHDYALDRGRPWYVAATIEQHNEYKYIQVLCNGVALLFTVSVAIFSLSLALYH